MNFACGIPRPLAPFVIIFSLLAGAATLPAASTLTRLLPAGADGFIVLQARPDPGLVAWAVEEQLPGFVTPADISDGGRYDPYTHKVKWGPFTDTMDRDLAYRLTATGSGEVMLAGLASWDGAAPMAATGETTLIIAGDGGFTDWLIATFGSDILGTPQADPNYDGDNDGNALLAEYYFGLDPAVPDTAPLSLQVGPDSLALILQRRRAAADLPNTLWFSKNLLQWAEMHPGSPVQLSSEGELETIQYDFGELGEPTFIRLQLGN